MKIQKNISPGQTDSTVGMAIMDKLFRAFKGALKHSIHSHYAKKIKANAKQVQRRKAEIASKVARGEATSETELAKTRLVVGLDQMDLGPILFRELLEDEFANPSSPIATRFTKEKVMAVHRKLGFDPYSKAILKKQGSPSRDWIRGGDRSNQSNEGFEKRI